MVPGIRVVAERSIKNLAVAKVAPPGLWVVATRFNWQPFKVSKLCVDGLTVH